MSYLADDCAALAMLPSPSVTGKFPLANNDTAWLHGCTECLGAAKRSYDP